MTSYIIFLVDHHFLKQRGLMSQIHQLLRDLGKHADAVKQCTQPLTYLGITCFYYVHIKNNGDYRLLTDSPHIDEYYFDEKLYIKDPYIRHPSNYQTGFFLFEQNQKEEFDQSLAYLVNNFQITPLIGFCQRNKDSVEFYGFWGRSDHSCTFSQVYLNYSNLLKIFTTYFKEKCRQILESDTVPYLSLSDLFGTEFVSSHGHKTKNDLDAICKYLREVGFSNEIDKVNLLSHQERECVKLLLKGKSAKETASSLELSFRTVEHYLDNVKNKFNCQYKNEIFAAAEKLNELGLL